MFARLSDESVVDEIVALEEAAFTNPWSRDALLWELRNSDVTRVYTARDDTGALVAFCACWIVFDELHVNTLAVTAAARRRHVGTDPWRSSSPTPSRAEP